MDQSPLYAAIDLGSNSFHMLVVREVAGAIRTPTYLASAPQQTRATMEPAAVAREALAALGKQPYVIPGLTNKLASFLMRHLLPRRWTIQLMGRILRDMYM